MTIPQLIQINATVTVMTAIAEAQIRNNALLETIRASEADNEFKKAMVARWQS